MILAPARSLNIRTGVTALAVSSVLLLLVACTGGPRTLNVGFYAHYAPISHSADESPTSQGFNAHTGYEADLLTALESMDGAELSFNRRAIPEWSGIWLKSAGDEFDIVGGGISILDSRTRNDAGETLIAFTSGHITFRQSLLVRTTDSGRLATHDDLTSDEVVGVFADTTVESRLLQLSGLTNADGVLVSGTRIETTTGEIIADGSADYTITAAGSSPVLVKRQRLYPSEDGIPQVVYLPLALGEDARHRMLRDGQLDALAGEEIENSITAHVSDGSLTVTALDHLVEHGGFTVAAGDTELLALLNERIDFLTDGRRIGFAEWQADPAVFMRRAAQWGK